MVTIGEQSGLEQGAFNKPDLLVHDLVKKLRNIYHDTKLFWRTTDDHASVRTAAASWDRCRGGEIEHRSLDLACELSRNRSPRTRKMKELGPRE
jgi:hypothetical protein